jgi:phage terminase large subunit-like protein
LRRLSWPNGAIATLYSAAEPDSLRGPQHSHGWADEIAKWDNAVKAWNNLDMTLRLSPCP